MVTALALKDSFKEFQYLTKQILLEVANSSPVEASDRIASFLEQHPSYASVALAVAAPVPSHGTPYSRKVAYSSDFGEAMVAHWRAGAACQPHDHGQAGGVVVALKGDFFEQAYSMNGGFKKIGGETAFLQGTLHVVIAKEIHSMRAAKEGITLHLYTPSTKGMKIYDEISRTILTVAEDCGAWIPTDPTLILKSEPLDRSSLYN